MSVQDLVLLSDAKAWLEVSGSSEDALISAQITMASNAILSYLDRSVVAAQSVTEVYDGRGSSVLITRNFPVTAVTSLTVDNLSIPAASGVTGYGFRFDANRVFLNGGARIAKGIANVTLAYTAGYATVPEPIKQATLAMLKALRESQSVDPNVAHESIPGAYTASYSQTGAGSVPLVARSLLQPYKRVSMA